MARDAGRASIEIEIWIAVEATQLRIIDFLDTIAATQRQVATAGTRRCLENLYAVALAAELIGSRQTRDASTEDDDCASTARDQRRQVRDFDFLHGGDEPQAGCNLIGRP